PPGGASPYGVYWPVLVPASEVRPEVYLDGEPVPLDSPGVPSGEPVRLDGPGPGVPSGPAPVPESPLEPSPALADGPTVRMPLGRVAGARSGDKGGNANLGVWTTSPERYAWLAGH